MVGSHVHARSFGGLPMPFAALLDYLRGSGTLFASIYRIGQRLPGDGECTYCLDCPGVPVKPSLKSDFHNARSLLDLDEEDIYLTLSMTFADLSDPDGVEPRMRLLQEEFPGVFGMMGEVNLKKQTLFDSGRPGAEAEHSRQWKPFMNLLAEWDFPITIHSDLGHDESQLHYLHLMEQVFSSYPDNKIIWPHLGLSKELQALDAAEQLVLPEDLLERFSNLYFDLSWRILYDQIFHDPEHRKL